MDWWHRAVTQVETFTGWDLPVVLSVLLTSLTLLILYTRLTTGSSSAGNSASKKPPPSLPYWIPYFGHLFHWLLFYNETLEETKDAFDTGVSTLKLGGEKHHIISSSQLGQNISISFKGHLSDVIAKKRIWRNVFGVPKDQLSLYHELVSAIEIPVSFHLNAELDEKKLASGSLLLRRLQGNIPDLITFNASLIDQEPWEKVSAVKVSQDQKTAGVSLLPLVFLFLTHMTTDTFVSDNLLSDQDHLETGPMLLAFVQSYASLMTGIPRWIPHPTLPGAYMTRRALLKHLDALLDTTEDVELQNDLLTARARMLDDHKAPRAIRTIELLRLLHGLNMPHILTFWMLLHIISDSTLLERIRKEASSAVSIIQEKPVMGFTVPPRVTIDPSALFGPKTPLLKQCWLETARLYSRGQQLWTATSDFEFEGQKGGVFNSADKWSIHKDDWVDVPLWHGNNDGTAWDEPARWTPERHAQITDAERVSDNAAVSESPGLFGMDEASKPARLFGLAFVASAVLLYDFEIDGDKSLPKAKFAPGVALPEGDVRVRMCKRMRR